MTTFAEYTDAARQAIEKGDMNTLADIMDANFEFASCFSVVETRSC
jgi:hypothetical protein